MNTKAKLFFGNPFPNTIGINFGLLVLRVFSGLTMAFGHGIRKIPPSEGFINGTADMGFPLPGFFSWMAGLSEFAGGILIAFGLFTRPSALLLGATMFIAGFIRHGEDPFGKMELALLYSCISLALLLTGPGKYSLDNLISKKLG